MKQLHPKDLHLFRTRSLEWRLSAYFICFALITSVALTVVLTQQFLRPAIHAASLERAQLTAQHVSWQLETHLSDAVALFLDAQQADVVRDHAIAFDRAFVLQTGHQMTAAHETLRPIGEWLSAQDELLDLIDAIWIYRSSAQGLQALKYTPDTTPYLKRGPANTALQPGRPWTYIMTSYVPEGGHTDLFGLQRNEAKAPANSGWNLVLHRGQRNLVYRTTLANSPDGTELRLLLSFGPRAQHAILNELVIRQRGTTLLMTREGHPLARAGAESPTLGDLDWAGILAGAADHEAIFLPDYQDWSISAAPIALGGSRLWLVQMLPDPALGAMLQEQLIGSTTLAALLFLLCILAARRVARRIAKPLAELTDWTRHLDAESIPEPPKLDTAIPEIRLLADAQAQMQSLLNQRNARMRDMQRQLEERAVTSDRRWERGQSDLLKRNQELQTSVELLRQAEKRLSESKLQLDLALGAAGLGVWNWKPDTDTLGWDESSCRIFRRAPEDMPTSFAELLGSLMLGEDKRLFSFVREAKTSPGQPVRCEFKVRAGSGYQTFRIDGQASKGDHPDQFQLTGTVRDITEDKEREETLEAARCEAVEASRAMSQFLAMMSHEIRTPMFGILGNLELLALDDLSQSQRDFLHTMQESTNHLLMLINDILDFSKIRAGKLKIDWAEIAPLHVIEGAISAARAAFAEKGVDLQLRVGPDIAQRVQCDPMRLRQILSNLLSNALKFTEKGHVRVEISVLQDSPDRQIMLFEVKDTGIGIPADRIDMVMKPFAQADGSVTRNYGGTGLGLPICSQLADLMGGRIELKSVEGVGTTVSLQLRWEKAEHEGDKHWSLDGLPVLFVALPESMRDSLCAWCRSLRGVPVIVESLPVDLASIGLLARTRGAEVIVMFVDAMLLEGGLTRSDLSDLVHSLQMPVILIDLLPGQPTVLSNGSHPVIRLPGAPVLPTQFIRALYACEQLNMEHISEPNEYSADDVKGAFALNDQRPVLLAEDHPTNQALIRQQLSVLGLDCEICPDGQQALNALHKGDYALLLSDCHMPVMDGFALARQIRSEERLNGTATRIPIIALTADAIGDVRDKCLMAGMNDYLSKPTNVKALGAMLQKWIPGSVDNTAATSDHAREGTTDGPLDMDQLMVSFMDKKIVRSILRDYLRTNRSDVEKLNQAVKQKDLRTAMEFAHRLKGAARIIGATGLAGCSEQIELAARAQNHDNVEALMPAFHGEITSVSNFIENYL